MKRKFSLIALFLGILLAFPLIGCGGEEGDEGGSENSGNNNGGNTSDDGVTANNWQSIIAEHFGATINLPSGWTFSSGEDKTFGYAGPEYELYFTTDAEDFAASYSDFVNAVFDATEAVTPEDGNYDALEIYPFEKGDRFETAPSFEVWYFSTATHINSVTIINNESTKTAGISIAQLYTKTW